MFVLLANKIFNVERFNGQDKTLSLGFMLAFTKQYEKNAMFYDKFVVSQKKVSRTI